MILVVGATGELGRRVCKQLVSGGELVRAMARDPERAESLHGMGAEVVKGDLRYPETVLAAIEGCDAVIDCATGRSSRFGGSGNSARVVDDKGPATLVQAAREAGVRRIIYVSALGAAPDAPLETLRMKYRAEWHVLHSGLHFTILRPAAFAETFLEPLAARVASGRRAHMPGDPSTVISFVSAEDVARLALLALTDRDLEDRTLDVAGPCPVTLERAVRAMERASGTSVARTWIPPFLMRIASVFVSFFDPELAERLDYGWCVTAHPHTCESAGLERMLPAWRPHPVERLAEEFATLQ